MAGVPVAIAGAPLRTVRPKMLRGIYSNPEKELVRLRDTGRVVQIARGTYIAKPDDVPPGADWRPGLEAMAMGYATAVFGPRVPILFGLGAARFHHAIPRALNVTVVAVPQGHRPVRFATGGRAVFTVRGQGAVKARPERTELGLAMVATPEQTLIDLLWRPNLGGLPDEALAAAAILRGTVDRDRLDALVARLPGTVQKTLAAFMGDN